MFVAVAGRMILGIIGGLLGLLMTPIILIIGVVLLVFTGGAGFQVVLLSFLGAIAAIVGILGAILSGRRRKLGGVIMLVSGLTPLLAGTILFASIAGTRITGVFAPFFALYFWCFILILAGILSLRSKLIATPVPPPPRPGPPA